MKTCPRCGKWSYEFDDYFERFRCRNPECSNRITSSSYERTLNLFKTFSQPEELVSIDLDNPNITVKTIYDNINDVLIFDSSSGEYIFELPDSNDDRIIWRVSTESASIAGFIILEVSQSDIDETEIQRIANRKYKIEGVLKELREIVSLGRATNILVESISERISSEVVPLPHDVGTEYTNALIEGLRKFRERTTYRKRLSG